MKRDEAVQQLRAARKELQGSVTGLTEEDLLRPKAMGQWSVKDILAHVASWDAEILRVIQAIAMQPEPQYSYAISDRSDFGVWNEEQVASRRLRPAPQILRELENTRRDLIQAIDGVTDQVLVRPKLTSWGKKRTGLEILQEIVDHDLEHAAQIRSWRRKRARWARAHKKYVGRRRTTKKKRKD